MAFKDWIGPIVGAAGAVGASAGSNIGNRRAMYRAQRFNQDNWNLQNEYNHPSQQMQRLREAGLNPNLIYGTSAQGSTGQADKIAAVKPSNVSFENPINSIGAFANLKSTRATTDNVQAKTTNTFQDTALKGMQTLHEATKGSQAKFSLGKESALFKTSLQAAEWGVKQQEANFIGKFLDNTLKNKTLQPQIMDVVYRVKNAEQVLKGQKLTNQLKQYEIELNKLGITKNDPLYARIIGRNFHKFEQTLATPKGKGFLKGLKYNPANIIKF